MKTNSSFRRIITPIYTKLKTLGELIAGIYKEFFDTIVFIFLVLILAAISRMVGKPLDTQDQNLLQNFIEWYAVFYTVALSYIVGHSWQKRNKINSAIDREADALALLIQTVRMCDNAINTAPLIKAVKDYVNHIRIIRAKDNRENVTSLELIRRVRQSLQAIINEGKLRESVEAELIHQYNEAYDARGDRFDLIEQQIPSRVWGVLVFFSLAWLWGFFWLSFCHILLNNYVLGCTIFSITYIFTFARDLDDPTKGFWTMKFEPFDNRLI